MKPLYYKLSGFKFWELHATHGFTLELLLPELAKEGMIPIWHQIFIAAHNDGANLKRLCTRLVCAVEDSYPKEVAMAVAEKLPLLLDWMRQSDHADKIKDSGS